MNLSLARLNQILGPGILMAAAAIGVSHLVQSTRAGANFGFELIGLILLTNLMKYPFFEYGHRFYAATGTTLLDGYKKLGKGYLYTFLILNFFTAMASVAAVTFVTGALCQNLFGETLSLPIWCGILLILCMALLAIGHYKTLDKFIKVLMVLLLISTLAALVAALTQGSTSPPFIVQDTNPWQWAHIGFLLALMGWMPAPIELSVWQSLWMEAKDRSSTKKTSMKEALLDFNFGYILTVVTAVIFCSLGALVMFESGQTFSGAAAAFAKQVIDLYTSSLGEWSRPIISLAAIATMFSTTLTLVDAYPRSLAEGSRLAFSSIKVNSTKWLNVWFGITCIVALVIIFAFKSHLKSMVDAVTIMAFLAGPFFAFINFRLIRSELVPKEFQPGRNLIYLSYVGFIFFVGFAGLFLYSRFS